MKSIGVQYLEAIRRLKAKQFVPLRTIHVSFIPGKIKIELVILLFLKSSSAFFSDR